MCRFIAILLFFSGAAICTAQVEPKRDTLKDAVIHGNKVLTGDARLADFAPGQKLLLLDSQIIKQYALQSAAELLSRQMPVFIKSYGFNGLATLNFRGSSAAQSAVLWNGIPIKNAALGVADVSTLPVMLHKRISILYGGSSALLGSGNVGGALLLESGAPVFDSGRRGVEVCLGAGSYAQFLGGISVFAASKKWFVSVRLNGQLAKNNFEYTNASGIQQRLDNSRLKSGAFLLQLARRTGKYSRVELFLWLQQYERQIPPALFESLYATRQQTDASNRVLATWQHTRNSSHLYAKVSAIEDRIRYEDQAPGINTHARVVQLYQEFGWRYNLQEKGQLIVFVPIQTSWMKGMADTAAIQNTTAIATAYELKLLQQKLNIATSLRAEKTNGTAYLLPGADAAYKILNWCTVRASVQRSWRVPALNELYYFPGGNADLKPENGWTQEGGYTIHMDAGRFSIYQSGSLFNRNINDWIIWLGGAVWTPHNIARVHSRGIETESRLTSRIGKITLHAEVLTSYVLATTTTSYLYKDGSVGKQIPYTPRYNARGNAGFEYLRFYLNYNHTYTGYRFTVSDESAWLLPYQTGNLQLQYTTKVAGHALLLTGQLNNIWNVHYQVVDQRPMPGTNWLLGLKTEF